MALPMSSAPTYTLTVPSTGAQVKYRPFLVKEEKALMIAQQSEDPVVMVETLKNVIQACVVGDIDASKLATFDLEYIFTQLRAKSVGEIVDLNAKCDDCEDDKAVTVVKIDLTKLEVQKNPEHTNKIELFDDVGVVLKYPSIDIIKKMESMDPTDVEQVFDIVVGCVDYIYNSQEVFYAKDQTKEELTEFLNNLTNEQFQKVQSFFETMPKLSKEIEYDCPVCRKHHVKVLAGLQSFF
jgi:hypothetical protein